MWIRKFERDRNKSVTSPVPTQMLSTEEFIPRPQNERQKHVEHLIGEMSEQKAKKLAMDRRKFMGTSMGLATCFCAMNTVYGKAFDVDEAETTEEEATAEKWPMGMPLVKCDCTSITKDSPFGHFSAVASSSVVSASSTSKALPYTVFIAQKQVASPMEVPMNLRRSMASFLAFCSDISPIRCSTCFCRSFCGRGINSSVESIWVGTGEVTLLFRSRSNLRIHIGFSIVQRVAQAFLPVWFLEQQSPHCPTCNNENHTGKNAC